MIRLLRFLKSKGCRLIGPNCPGVISPGRSKVGFMPDHVYTPGPVGVLSKSGSLSYEVSFCLSRVGINHSTVVGLGGDPVRGSTFIDVLPLFMADGQTQVVVLLVEIGGSDEEEAAEWLKTHATKKPVVAYVVGSEAPGWRGNLGTWRGKVTALTGAGVTVVDTPWDLVAAVQRVLSGTHN